MSSCVAFIFTCFDIAAWKNSFGCIEEWEVNVFSNKILRSVFWFNFFWMDCLKESSWDENISMPCAEENGSLPECERAFRCLLSLWMMHACMAYSRQSEIESSTFSIRTIRSLNKLIRLLFRASYADE